MAIILPEILNVPLADIHIMPMPSVCYGNGGERLKRIIYSARYYLAERPAAEIKAACADALYLYRWFFEHHAQQIREEAIQENQIDLNQASDFDDLNHFVENSVQDLELAHLSEVDVLTSILYTTGCTIFNQIDGVQSDFSNVEFFSVLALYQSSIALAKLIEIKTLTEEKRAADNFMPSAIEQAYDAILEAQVAVDQARQLNTVETPEFSCIIQDYITQSRQAIALKGSEARYGEKYRQRRAKAIELYQKGNYRSRLEAALYIITPVQEYSAELGIALLKPDSAQETIYRWLSQHDKETVH